MGCDVTAGRACVGARLERGGPLKTNDEAPR